MQAGREGGREGETDKQSRDFQLPSGWNEYLTASPSKGAAAFNQ